MKTCNSFFNSFLLFSLLLLLSLQQTSEALDRGDEEVQCEWDCLKYGVSDLCSCQEKLLGEDDLIISPAVLKRGGAFPFRYGKRGGVKRQMPFRYGKRSATPPLSSLSSLSSSSSSSSSSPKALGKRQFRYGKRQFRYGKRQFRYGKRQFRYGKQAA